MALTPQKKEKRNGEMLLLVLLLCSCRKLCWVSKNFGFGRLVLPTGFLCEAFMEYICHISHKWKCMALHVYAKVVFFGIEERGQLTVFRVVWECLCTSQCEHGRCCLGTCGSQYMFVLCAVHFSVGTRKLWQAEQASEDKAFMEEEKGEHRERERQSDLRYRGKEQKEGRL